MSCDVNMVCQPVKELKLQSLGRLWPFQDLSEHVRVRRKVKLEDRLPCASHVGENGLAKMPAEKGGWRAAGVLEQALFQNITCATVDVGTKVDDLVAVLQIFSNGFRVNRS